MKTPMILKLIATMGALFLGMSTAQAHTSKPEGSNAYLFDNNNHLVKNNYGQCWRTGYWTPAQAIVECDPDLVKKPEAKPEVVAEAPAPAPMPAPAPAAIPPEYEKVTLGAETLFDFNKATLRPTGKAKLDELASKLGAYTNLESVAVTGHTDRIGSDAYNHKLSHRRATTVKDYLVAKGVDSSKITAEGKGETQPVTKGCKGNKKTKKLIACLQPDRRVEVEIATTRQK